jgi:type II secretory pathway pseudopilin PulG
MNENAPNQISSPENNQEGKTFLGLIEKHPKLRQTAMMLAVLAGTVGAAEKANAEQVEESEAQQTYQEAATQAEYNQNIDDILAGFDNEETVEALREVHTLLNEQPDLAEALQNHFYYSTDTTESFSHSNETDTEMNHSFLNEDIGELPVEGKDVMFGSFTKTGSLQVIDAGSNASTMWSGVSSHEVMATADVALEAGGTMTRVGVGETASEALEAALKDAVSFLGLDVSADRVNSEHNADSDYRNTVQSNAVSYIHEYKVMNSEVVPSQWGGADEHKVTGEITVGVPVLE